MLGTSNRGDLIYGVVYKHVNLGLTFHLVVKKAKNKPWMTPLLNSPILFCQVHLGPIPQNALQ